MKASRFVVPALALVLLTSSGTVFAQGYGAPPPGYAQGGWDAPPPEFREFQQKGFHDGVEGARKDFANHRPPSPGNRDEFRHPHVPRDMRDDYRDGFRKGYFAAMHHLEGNPGYR